MSSKIQKAAKEPLNNQTLKPRPPIVAVMGHVDHGKTTLLDYIRKTKVAEKEAGGITQSIGAYEIEKNGQRITFVDTPGHEAFTKMRQRGAQVADIAILVVAADDGAKPQTIEAIKILQESKTPFVVAINKIDKNNADEDRVKNDLAKHGVDLEGMGGNISWHAISAKQGTGIEELLDLVILMWQMENPMYNPQSIAKGFILESRMDSRRGLVASIIVTDGILKVGDDIVTPSAGGKVKILENFIGERVDSLDPSSPALIIGFEEIPVIGESFEAGELDLIKRQPTTPQIRPTSALQTQEESGLKIILKADLSGSLEALVHVLSDIYINDKKIKIMYQEVGEVTDGDIRQAVNFGAIIVGFNTRVSKSAENLARGQNVKVVTSNIIYRIVEALEDSMKAEEKEKEPGKLEVLAVFSQKNKKQLIGGKVVAGYLSINHKISIIRDGKELGFGRVTNLQQNKLDVKRVEDGECGLMVESPNEIQVGDTLIVAK